MPKEIPVSADLTSNIISIYNQVSRDKITLSILWYHNAHNFCLATSAKFGLSLEIVAGVLAILSPRNKWENNKQDCINIIEAYLSGKNLDSIKVRTFNKNKQKAWNLLKTKNVEISGQKVKSFYRNIVNPFGMEDVTVDTWAVRVALNNSKSTLSPNKTQYKIIKEAYQKAFNELSNRDVFLRTPSQLQAICWEHIRDA
jgi:hypothetical protein